MALDDELFQVARAIDDIIDPIATRIERAQRQGRRVTLFRGKSGRFTFKPLGFKSASDRTMVYEIGGKSNITLGDVIEPYNSTGARVVYETDDEKYKAGYASSDWYSNSVGGIRAIMADPSIDNDRIVQVYFGRDKNL